MLVFVKKGWMASLTEKRLNSYIQTWIRAPGCVVDAFLVWAGFRQLLHRQAEGITPLLSARPEVLQLPSIWILYPIYGWLAFSMFWNGPYFGRRVVESYQRHRLKVDELASKKKVK